MRLIVPPFSPLWLTSTSKVPTCDFFITRLHQYFKKDVGGQSMRVGGATSLAEHGIPPSLIQLMGHWSSEAFLHPKKSRAYSSPSLFRSHTLIFFSQKIPPLSYFLFLHLLTSTFSSQKKIK